MEGGQACSDMCILQDATEEPLVCAVTWDFKLKIWSADVGVSRYFLPLFTSNYNIYYFTI